MRRVFLLAFIWGWSFLFIRVIVEGAPPAFMVAGRVTVGAVVVVAALLRRGTRFPRDAGTWFRLSILAMAYCVGPWLLLGWAEQHVTSALAAVVNASTPMFTAAFAVPILGSRLRPVQVAGLAVAMGGVAIVSGVGGHDVSGSSLAGVFAVLGASAMYGFSFCFVRRALSGVAPLVITAGQLLVAAAVSLPLAGISVAVKGADLTTNRLIAVGLLGIFGTGVGYLMVYRVIAEMGAMSASLVTFLVPIVGVAVGVAVLGESFSFRLVVGGAVVLVGVALVQRGGGLRRSRSPEVGSPSAWKSTRATA